MSVRAGELSCVRTFTCTWTVKKGTANWQYFTKRISMAFQTLLRSKYTRLTGTSLCCWVSMKYCKVHGCIRGRSKGAGSVSSVSKTQYTCAVLIVTVSVNTSIKCDHVEIPWLGPMLLSEWNCNFRYYVICMWEKQWVAYTHVICFVVENGLMLTFSLGK